MSALGQKDTIDILIENAFRDRRQKARNSYTLNTDVTKSDFIHDKITCF